tara:strand:+ start:3288 stop:4577 length:1290 start_codon:yes stop_codon:yes gene_type:complete
MKNVLFIAYYFPPMGGSGVQRPLKFVKYLRKSGWNPIVLCPEPGAYHTFDDSLADELEQLDIEVHRVKGNTPFHKTGAQKKVSLPNWLTQILRKVSVFFWLPDNKKGWIEPAQKLALELIEKKNIEIIFSTAAPYSNLMLAGNLKKNTGLPVVMDLRDEWLESHLIKYPTSWHKQKMKKIEAETLSQANVLTVINEPYKESIGSRYPALDIRVINQGYDPEDFAIESNEQQKSGKLTLFYSGLFYGDRKPDLFLESIYELLLEKPDYKSKLELHFQGGLDAQTLLLIEKYKLQEVIKDYGYVNHKVAVKNIMKADVLWLMVGHMNHSDKVTVGKMFEYFGTKKPILALVPEGGTRTLLGEYGAFYTANPGSKNEIKSELQKIFRDFENKTFPIANYKFVVQYDRSRIAAELAKLFSEVIETNQAKPMES